MRNKSSFGWSELLTGILFVAFGFFALANPNLALGGFVIVFGITMLISGVSGILFYSRINKRVGFGPVSALISGIFEIILCVVLLLNIGAGKWVFSLIFPLWFIIHCFGRLANLNFMKLMGGNLMFWVSLILNMLGVFAGIFLLFSRSASMNTLGLLIGLNLIIQGCGSIYTFFGRLGDRNDGGENNNDMEG